MFWITGAVLAALTFSQVSAGPVDSGVYNDNASSGGVLTSSERIGSGWEALPGQFPYAVYIRFMATAGNGRDCGGSIIHRNWVVSSAFCPSIWSATYARVRAGVTDLSITPEYDFVTSELWVHPSFDVSNLYRAQPYDVSIVKLQRPLTYSALVQPIRVVSSADAYRDYSDEVVYTMGWGRLPGNIVPNVLNWVYLRVISNQNCRESGISENNICAVAYNVSSQATCFGDEGGPLMHNGRNGEPVLVGVVARWHGSTSCNSSQHFGFNRLGPIHGWLTEITGLNFDEAIGPLTTEAPEPPTTAVTEPPTTAAPEPSTTEVTEPPTTEVTEPPTTEVTEPPNTEATEPPTTEATEPPTTEVTEPPITEATEPPTTEATEPPTTALTEPPTTEVTEPPTTEATEPPNTEATEPPTTEATEPPTTEVTEPPITEATEPPTTEATEPPTTAVTEPPTTEVTEPPTTEATEPPITEATKPPTTEATEPPTTAATEPESEENDQNDSSDSKEDPEISQLLKKLQVKLLKASKVKVTNDIKIN